MEPRPLRVPGLRFTVLGWHRIRTPKQEDGFSCSIVAGSHAVSPVKHAGRACETASGKMPRTVLITNCHGHYILTLDTLE